MIMKWLSSLLILLIVSQSVVAAVDVHQALQTQANEAHHDSGHAHGAANLLKNADARVSDITTQDTQTALDLLSQPSENNDLDCSHCCQCHGASLLVMIDQFVPAAVDFSNVRFAELRSLILAQHSSLDLRPPIA